MTQQHPPAPTPGNDNNAPRKGALVRAFACAVAGLAILYAVTPSDEGPREDMSYKSLVDQARKGEIDSVTTHYDGRLEVRRTGAAQDSKPLLSHMPPGADIMGDLKDTRADVSAVPPRKQGALSVLLLTYMPVALLVGGMYLLMRRQAGGGKPGGILPGITGSPAKLLKDMQKRVTFSDVAGIDEVRADVEEVVDYLKNPAKYHAVGARVPRGVLLSSPPGTGKTLLARALAGEAGVPFFSISGSNFVEMFVGVGASRVRSMFAELKKNAPCILFIDEIDAVGRHRAGGAGGVNRGGHDEREQTLNQILVEMDGLEGRHGAIIVAATNRPDVLDPALLRPGRFDRTITVHKPDIVGRRAILGVHTRNKPLGDDVDLDTVARGTPGFTGAELENLANEAALSAARRGGQSILARDFEDARDKLLMGGNARNSTAFTPELKRKICVHEAGHAVIVHKLQGKGADPLHKISVIPRGMGLGVTMQLPQGDAFLRTREEMEASLAILAGGRAAEEDVYGPGKVSTGASNDIERITQIANVMVRRFGFGDDLAPMAYSDGPGVLPGLARESQKTQEKVDAAVAKLAGAAMEKARDIVRGERAALDRLADALYEHETLDGPQAAAVLDGRNSGPAFAPVLAAPRR